MSFSRALQWRGEFFFYSLGRHTRDYPVTKNTNEKQTNKKNVEITAKTSGV